MKESKALAREHFKSMTHDGPLVASYRVDDDSCIIFARPSNPAYTISTIVPVLEDTEQVVQYVHSTIFTWGMDNLLIREFEVFQGEVV